MIPRLNLGRKSDYLSAYLSGESRTRGVFIGGATGSGKSTLIENMLYQDMLFNMTAIVLVDPSGFLAKKAYAMAKTAKREAMYCSAKHPIGINPLITPFTIDQNIDNLIELVNHFVTTVTENQPLTTKMRRRVASAVRWCLESNRPRLDAVIHRLLNDPSIPKDEATAGLVDRLELLLIDEVVREIICREESIDWQEFTAKKKVLILDTFGLSFDKKVFIGSVITHSIKSYFRNIDLDEYEPLVLYVDEAHNFVNPGFNDVFKEGRKYQVCPVLATQDFASIPKKLTHTLLSNVGTIIAFKSGYREAIEFANEFKWFERGDIQFPNKHHCTIKTPDWEDIVLAYAPPIISEVALPVLDFKPQTACGWH